MARDAEYLQDIQTLPLKELQQKYRQKGDPTKPTIKDERSLKQLRRKYEGEGRLVKTWEVSAFDHSAGEWTTTTNHSYEYTPEQDAIDVESLLISRAAPVDIHPIDVPVVIRDDKLTVCLGDAQIGYRGLEPFHDENALALSLIAIRELQPDTIVFTGDMIDLPNMSRWEQRPDWLDTTQRSINRYHRYLAEVRTNAPNAKIVVVHGNHEARMDTTVRRDAAPFLGLTRANADRELPVLTLQYLVRYEELKVEVVDGYPNAAYWLEDNLKVTHGTNVKKGGSNAAKYLAEESESTIFGHTHRVELCYRTRPTRAGQMVFAAASPGCLARTDGAVPGFRYSVDALGNTVPRAEDWQQGLLIIHHNPQTHDIHPIRFNGRSMRMYDKVYELGENNE